MRDNNGCNCLLKEAINPTKLVGCWTTTLLGGLKWSKDMKRRLCGDNKLLAKLASLAKLAHWAEAKFLASGEASLQRSTSNLSDVASLSGEVSRMS